MGAAASHRRIPRRCAHGCLLFREQTLAHGCTGCASMGGAFVLADGHKHVGGCDGMNCASCNCSFGREPIYDHRAYRDLGVDEPLPGYCLSTSHKIAVATDDLVARKRRCERTIDRERDARIAVEVQAIIDAPWKKSVAPSKPRLKNEVDENPSKPLPRLGVPWLKPFWPKPTFDVIPLGAFPIERVKAGWNGKNGISQIASSSWEPLILEGPFARRIGQDAGGVRMDHTPRYCGRRYEDFACVEKGAAA
jgi:hypothetical protein